VTPPSTVKAVPVKKKSSENFSTTLFPVGSETTLPINLYLQGRDGRTPVINAISFPLIVGTSLLATVNL
jgi:spermidine/putrescine transport system permease protein